jgi:pilus assembly protein CpaE
MILIVSADPVTAQTLQTALGGAADVVPDLEAARRRLAGDVHVDVVVVGPTVDTEPALELAASMRVTRPDLGVVLVRRRVDTTMLADAIRAGVREVVTERDLSALSEAVHRSTDLAHAMREQSGAIGAEELPVGALVTVFSAKGGCGKTTLATNLAAALADNGRREVCLVDLDLAFGDVAIALQLFPAHTIADAVPMAGSLDAGALSALLTPHSPGLTTLVAPVEPGAAEIPASLVASILRMLKEQYQYVVIDTPPAFSDHVLAAFDESDVIALLATLDIPALKNLKLTLETLDLLNYPRDRWRVVLNRADSKVGLALSEVEKTLRMPIAAQVPSSRDVPASINRGVPIVLDQPTHPVSLSIKQFAEQYVVPAGGAAAAGAIPTELRNDRRGLFRWKARTS